MLSLPVVLSVVAEARADLDRRTMTPGVRFGYLYRF